MIVQAVLTSRARYGSIPFHLTRAQLRKLEILFRAELRVATGLQTHTVVTELYRHSGLPPPEDVLHNRVKGRLSGASTYVWANNTLTMMTTESLRPNTESYSPKDRTPAF